MSESEDTGVKPFAWLRSRFEIEGWVGALAAWLVGILLSILWGPLFWIGFAGAVVILLATRITDRSPPEGEDLIGAPCDGVVVSIMGVAPPDELRLEGLGWRRLRIATGPISNNGIHAPVTGAVEHIVKEAGDPAAIAALRPDTPGLALVYFSLLSGRHSMGMRVATGGFGPRLEVHVEPGDPVRLGRKLATRRLGGWCDVYIPKGAAILTATGRTLIGSETPLARFVSQPAETESVTPPRTWASNEFFEAETYAEDFASEDFALEDEIDQGEGRPYAAGLESLGAERVLTKEVQAETALEALIAEQEALNPELIGVKGQDQTGDTRAEPAVSDGVGSQAEPQRGMDRRDGAIRTVKSEPGAGRAKDATPQLPPGNGANEAQPQAETTEISEMFERLRKEARKPYTEPIEPESETEANIKARDSP